MCLNEISRSRLPKVWFLQGMRTSEWGVRCGTTGRGKEVIGVGARVTAGALRGRLADCVFGGSTDAKPDETTPGDWAGRGA